MRGQGRGGAQSTPASGSITLGGDVTGTAAATVVSAISGASPIVITPSVLQWRNGTATPTITQAALASTSAGSGAAGQGMSVTAQAGQAATGAGNNGGAGGGINFISGAGGTSGSATAGAPGNTYVGLPGASAYLQVQGATQNVNAVTSTGAIQLTATAGAINLTGTALATSAPLGGLSTTPLSFKGQTSPNTVACGTGGTQTISAAQAIIPFFLVTTGTTTSGVIVDFSTNASTGHFILDLSGVGNLAGGSLTLKNGTGTVVITATVLTALRAAGKTGVCVDTYGTNNITTT